MEFGPTGGDGTGVAQAWLQRHSHTLGLFIGGKFVHPEGREIDSVTDSAGQSVCSTVRAVFADVSLSVSDAREGCEVWGGLSCHARARHLYSVARSIQRFGQSLSAVAQLQCSPADLSALTRLLYHLTGWAQMRDSVLTHWSPRGVVAVISTGDCPLVFQMNKVFPAIAMGNTVVLRPSPQARLTSLLLAELCTGAGLPAGVLNVITGDDLSLAVALAEHSEVDMVTVTGRREEGLVLAGAAAAGGVPVSLSVGGLCPFIICDSADLDSAVDSVIDAAFTGKIELCQWQLLVQEAVWEAVRVRLQERIATLRCLPLVDTAVKCVLDAAIQDAVQLGATVSKLKKAHTRSRDPYIRGLHGPGTRPRTHTGSGPYFKRSAWSGASPVLLANNSARNLAASLWTDDVTVALESAKSLKVGTVWVNSHSLFDAAASFGGVRECGNTTDGGKEGLYQFLQPSLCPLHHPRPTPLSLDYNKFGETNQTAPLPETEPPRAEDPPSQTLRVDRSYKLYIGGVQCHPEAGFYGARVSGGGPGGQYCPVGSRKDVRNAVEAADKAQPGWYKKTAHVRAQILYFLAENLEQRREAFAQSLSNQTGLSLAKGQEEVDLSVAAAFDWASLCDKLGGTIQDTPQPGSTVCLRQPIGVVGVVCPDDRPLLSFVWLMGAAVSRGNTVVMVPSEKHPFSALQLIQVLETSDIPAGVVNIVSGERDHLTRHLANHSVVQTLWYWGSREGCQFVRYTCARAGRRMWVNESEGGAEREWGYSRIEESLQHSTQYKQVWIPSTV
ncbi:A16A1 dehydrogenase, partial [Amia calva]|nr:A16A1 dehydrogenase [Amia calva]